MLTSGGHLCRPFSPHQLLGGFSCPAGLDCQGEKSGIGAPDSSLTPPLHGRYKLPGQTGLETPAWLRLYLKGEDLSYLPVVDALIFVRGSFLLVRLGHLTLPPPPGRHHNLPQW
ncbi:UNVERIFIED_CONTAM: hypothetical protein K2H54_059810 [Gekko kuhli]